MVGSNMTTAGQKAAGPTSKIPNLSARAGRSISPPLAITRNTSSQPPGKATTAMRSCEFERLPHACGIFLRRVTTFPASASKYLAAICDACSAFQNDDMFVFILMNVHGRAIAGTRDDFNERVNAACVRRGYTYQALLARSCF